ARADGGSQSRRRSAPRDVRERDGGGPPLPEPVHVRGARPRVDGEHAADLTGRLLADVSCRERGGDPLRRSAGRPALAWDANAVELTLLQRLGGVLDRSDRGAGSLGEV